MGGGGEPRGEGRPAPAGGGAGRAPAAGPEESPFDDDIPF
jgi:hypothetical protein